MSSATGIVEANESRVQTKQGPWRGFEESKGFMYLLLTPILDFFYRAQRHPHHVDDRAELL